MRPCWNLRTLSDSGLLSSEMPQIYQKCQVTGPIGLVHLENRTGFPTKIQKNIENIKQQKSVACLQKMKTLTLI